MKKLGLVAATCSLLLLTGCLPVQSLNPLFASKDDLVSNPALVGRWSDEQDNDDQTIWDFRDSGDDSYQLVIKKADECAQWKFRVHLVRLGQLSFFDVQLVDLGVNGEDAGVPIFTLATHTIYRVWLEGDNLRFRGLDDDWLKKVLKEKQIAVSHHVLEDNVILVTASTQELQKLVLKYADDPQAFKGDTKLTRSK